jgi:lipoprotein-releasing system permease protein
LNFPLYSQTLYSTTVKQRNQYHQSYLYIIVGAMALFVVLSVFSGLKVFSLSFTNEIDPDLKISSTLNLLISPKQKSK